MDNGRYLAMGFAALVAAWGVAGCNRAKSHTGPAPAPSGKPGSESLIGFSQFEVGLWTKADSVTYFDNLKIETYDGP